MNIHVRRPNHAEIDVLVNLAEQSPYQSVDEDGKRSLKQHLETGRALIALANGSPAGLLLFRSHIWDNRPPFVEHIDVADDHKRQGIGRALMAGLERIAIQEGYPAIYSSTAEDNPESQRFHNELGFEVDCNYPLRDQKAVELMLSKLVDPPIEIPDNVILDVS